MLKSRALSHAVVFAASLLLLVPGAGCSLTPGKGFTLFPTGDPLLDATKDVRRLPPVNAALPRELTKSVLPAYFLQPGDVILIEPTSLDSPLRFASDQTIMPDGTIDLGRYGRINIAGKTVEQVEAEIQAAMSDGERKAEPVNVRLITAQSAVYYVLGEVNAPGSFPLVGRETVLDAIVAAGGLNDRASPCNIILSRPTAPNGCRIVLPVCYRHIVQLGDTTTNYQIQPGDRVYVATRTLCESLFPCFSRKGCPCCQGDQCGCPMSPSSPVPLFPGHIGEYEEIPSEMRMMPEGQPMPSGPILPDGLGKPSGPNISPPPGAAPADHGSPFIDEEIMPAAPLLDKAETES